MLWRIIFVASAVEHLRSLTSAEKAVVQREVAARLSGEPDRETKAVKRLRPNPLATHELRLGGLRVLYVVNAGAGTVDIVAIGRKVGNKLFVQGEEFHEHESDTP